MVHHSLYRMIVLLPNMCRRQATTSCGAAVMLSMSVFCSTSPSGSHWSLRRMAMSAWVGKRPRTHAFRHRMYCVWTGCCSAMWNAKRLVKRQPRGAGAMTACATCCRGQVHMVVYWGVVQAANSMGEPRVPRLFQAFVAMPHRRHLLLAATSHMPSLQLYLRHMTSNVEAGPMSPSLAAAIQAWRTPRLLLVCTPTAAGRFEHSMHVEMNMTAGCCGSSTASDVFEDKRSVTAVLEALQQTLDSSFSSSSS